VTRARRLDECDTGGNVRLQARIIQSLDQRATELNHSTLSLARRVTSSLITWSGGGHVI